MTTAKAFYGTYTNMGNTYHNGLMGSKVYTGNTLYSSGDINNSNSGLQYLFKERSGKIKWKEIMKLDLDGMVRNNDLSPLEAYLENLIFSNVDENDMQIVPETSFVTLVRMYQYILEYLLFTQQKLENDNKVLESNYNQLINDAMAKENLLKENKSLINTLKKDKKEKEMVLNTYKCLIDEYKSGKFGNVEVANNEKKYFYCKICEGKKFSTEENLMAHMDRRHYRESQLSKDQVKKDKEKEKEPNIEEKFEEMKTFFETYVKNFHNDSYLKIYENQKNLENKITEVKYERNHEIKEMENQFRNTLLDIKEQYLKNSMNNFGNSYMQTQRRDSDSDDEKSKKKLKKETKKMNEMLNQLNKDQNDKIQGILEQLSNFKDSISEELKNLKEEKEKKKEKKEKKEKKDKEKEKEKKEELRESSEEVLKRRKKEEAPSKKFTASVAHIESIELSSNRSKKSILVKDSQVQKSIPKTKLIFNAGPLESDNDSDNEIVIKNQSVQMKNDYRNSEDVKFSFAGGASLKNSLNANAVEEAPFEKSQDDVKKSIVENLEKEIELIEPHKQDNKPEEPEKKEDKKTEDIKNNKDNEDTKKVEQPVIEEVNKSEEIEINMKEEEIPEIKKKEEEPILKSEPVVNKLAKKEEAKEKLEKFFHEFTERDNACFDEPKFNSKTKAIL